MIHGFQSNCYDHWEYKASLSKSFGNEDLHQIDRKDQIRTNFNLTIPNYKIFDCIKYFLSEMMIPD